MWKFANFSAWRADYTRSINGRALYSLIEYTKGLERLKRVVIKCHHIVDMSNIYSVVFNPDHEVIVVMKLSTLVAELQASVIAAIEIFGSDSKNEKL